MKIMSETFEVDATDPEFLRIDRSAVIEMPWGTSPFNERLRDSTRCGLMNLARNLRRSSISSISDRRARLTKARSW